MKEQETKKYNTRFLKRHIVTSDNHAFIGRTFNLGIVELNFETYEELVQYPDALYAFHLNY